MPNNQPNYQPFAVLALVVIVTGALLRILTAWEIPLSNDELGTVIGSRLAYNEFFQHFIKADGHPPLYRFILYGWINLAGENAFIVRLPGLALGIGAMVLLYKATLRIAGQYGALILLTIWSLSGYAVIFSIVARPYPYGVFFIALTLWCLSIIHNQSAKRMHYLLLTLALAGCFYAHYFAAFTGAILVAVSLFILPFKFKKAVSISVFVSFLLFVPVIPVFIHQLQIGGVSWLPKPEIDFLFGYSMYLLNFSWAWMIISIIPALWGYWNAPIKGRHQGILLLCVGLLPLLVGWIWSVWVNSVLQYNVLVFSSILVFLALANGWEYLRNNRLKLILWAMLFVVGVLGLFTSAGIITKDHFGNFRIQARFIEKEISKLEKENRSYLVLFNGNSLEYLKYYLDRPLNLVWCTGTVKEKISTLSIMEDSLGPEVIISAWNNVGQQAEWEAWLEARYSYTEASKFQFNAGTTVRSKKYSNSNNDQPSLATWTPTEWSVSEANETIMWANLSSDNPHRDGLDPPFTIIDSTHPFGPVLQARLRDFTCQNSSTMVLEVLFHLVPDANGYLVCSVTGVQDKLEYYKSVPLSEFCLKPTLKTPQLAVLVSDLKGLDPDNEVRLYAYHTEGEPIQVHRMNVRKICDDRYRYLHPGYWFPALY